MKRTWIACLAFPLLAANPPAAFVEHTIASDLKAGYQVVAADLNRDGKLDLIGLGSNMTELVWFENPGWQRHVLATGVSRMINCTVLVTNGAVREIVLASEFENQAKNSRGKVSVLRSGDDPMQPWTATEIDVLTTSHRLRTADIDGSGRKVVINAPLTGAKAEAPDYRDQTPLVYYRPGEWKRQTISDENSGVVHGIFVIDWDNDGRDEILTASFTGIHLFKFGKDSRWTRTEIAKGDPAPWPKSGASDISVGRLGSTRFLAVIEPWHGNQLSIYRLDATKTWVRHVIDTTLADGHTVSTADLNGDGLDEVVAGYRGNGGGTHIHYAADASGEQWTKQPLDTGKMAAAACVVADLNSDGRPDLACIDSARLKWYENTGLAKPGVPAR